MKNNLGKKQVCYNFTESLACIVNNLNIFKFLEFFCNTKIK